MDEADLACDKAKRRLKLSEKERKSMGNIHDLMVNDARQSFFQLENLVSSLDAKAFGVVAIGSVWLSIFTYILTIFKFYSLYIPYLILMIAILSIIGCIFPRKWKRGSSLLNIKEHGNIDFEDAANAMAMNYAKWEDILDKKYNEKFKFFEIGLGLMAISIILEIRILIYLIFGL
jgi:hypothetical protein